MDKEFTRKEVMMTLANLMVSKLSHEEIEIFCISMLHANKVCQLSKMKEDK